MLLSPRNIAYGTRLVQMLTYDAKARFGPLRIDIAVTSACNYQCYFCNSHSYLRTQQTQPQVLSKDVLNPLFDDLELLHTHHILFAGNGEPLLAPYLPRVIKENSNRFKIELMTNGSMLEKVDLYLLCCLEKLVVSLNSGTGKSHKAIHGYSSSSQFETICAQISQLLVDKKEARKIRLNYVITKDNEAEIEAFKELASKWRVSYAIRPMSVDFEEARANAPCAEDNNAPILRPCYNGWMQPFISSSGDVLICSEGQAMPMGNILKSSFKDIWQDPKNIALRWTTVTMAKPLFRGCYGCANAEGYSQSFHNIFSLMPLHNHANKEIIQ